MRLIDEYLDRLFITVQRHPIVGFEVIEIDILEKRWLYGHTVVWNKERTFVESAQRLSDRCFGNFIGVYQDRFNRTLCLPCRHHYCIQVGLAEEIRGDEP